MAKQTINIGTVANDGTGDTLRSAMDKCNDNFTEVYGVTDALGTISTYDIWSGTTAEYTALGTYSDTTLYLLTD